MPETADLYQPFDAGAGSSVAEAGWRAMARHWLPDGVLVTDLPYASWDAELKVTAGVGLQVAIAAGEVWIQGHHGQWDSGSTLAVGANASGSSRVDYVVARADFVNNDIELDIVAGTPGAGAPSLTESSSVWEIPLATYTVTNGGSAPTSITDARRFVVPNAVSSASAAPIAPARGDTWTDVDTMETFIYYGATTGWQRPWNQPWGRIGYTALSGSVASSLETQLTGTVTFTAVANRYYKVTASVGFYTGAEAGMATAAIRRSTTDLAYSQGLANPSVGLDRLILADWSFVETLSAGSTTYNVSMTGEPGNVDASICISKLMVEDIGPSSTAPAS